MDIFVGARASEYDPSYESASSAVDTGTKTLVQQGFRDEQDINTIVRRFGLTLPSRGADGAMYGDFTGISDYESAVAMVRESQERFMQLPAELRSKFGNNPGNLVRFANEATEDEFVAYFEEKPAPVSPPMAPVAAPVAPAVPPVVVDKPA